MKRWISLGTVVALLVAALVLAQRRKPHAEVGPDAVLHFIGDTEQELSRIPMTATRLSDADEIRIGDELAQRYKYMEGFRNGTDDSDENKQFRRYIERVGSTVSSHAQRKLPYKFHYIPEQNLINAFAIPGGHVYIGKGLIDLMDSEDELASVLGHEVEHIDRRHAVERLQIEARLRHLGLARLLVELPLGIFQAGYSKEQELEADREGTRLSVISGYSPTGTVRMFEAFQRRFREAQDQQASSPQEETARVVLATMGGYFKSHPSSQERVAQIQNLMAQENWHAKSEKPFALAYLLWTDQAEIALHQHRYKEAVALSTKALNEGGPDFVPALELLARAEYVQGHFRQAANVYGQLVTAKHASSYIHSFSEMLALSDRATAPVEFQKVLGPDLLANNIDGSDDLVGLELISGDPQPANSRITELQSDAFASTTPNRTARIGWWLYLSGDYARARQLTELSAQQRPADLDINLTYAWTLIEAKRYADALTVFTKISDQCGCDSEKPLEASQAAIGLAVSNWLAQNPDHALTNWQTAIAREPAWTNPAWYAPQYSPTVSRAIAEMKAEADHRKKAVEVKARQAQ